MHRARFKPQVADSNHQYSIAEKLLQQLYTATAPNQKWVGDITYIQTGDGWLHLAFILDLFSRKVVGRAISYSPNAELACRALEIAVIAVESQETWFISQTGVRNTQVQISGLDLKLSVLLRA